MLRAVAYSKKVIRDAEKAHPCQKQVIANQPIYCFLFNSTALFSSSSSSRKSPSLHNYYIRKRRKWPIQPYKTQWLETFAFRLAKQSFKQSTKKTKAHLLSHLINSFSSYEINPTPQSYHFLFKILIQKRPPNCHDQISQILDHIEKVESFETPECIFIDLIKFYGDVNMFTDAVELFLRLPRFRCDPSVEVLNVLLSILCRNKKGLEMVPEILVKSTQVMKIRVEESSFGILIKALCRIGCLNNAYDLLSHMVEEGFGVDQKICSLMLATMCGQLNCNNDIMMGFLEGLKKLGFEPRKGDFCNLIRFMVKRGKSLDAFKLLKQMKVDGVKPDIMCYNLVLDGLIQNRDFLNADKVFDELLVLGLTPDIFTYDVYISGLIVQKKVDDGIKIFNSMDELGCKHNPTSYSSILRALCEAGEMGRVPEVMNQMRKECMRLNAETYEILIEGFISNGDVNGARGFIKEMMDNNFVPRVTILDSIVRCLCKSGMCSEAVELLGEEGVKDILVKANFKPMVSGV